MSQGEDKKNPSQGADKSASWDFKVEEKTLMDAINRDKRRDEIEKKNKVLKPERKLRIDNTAQIKRKELAQKESKQQVRSSGKLDLKKYADEAPLAYASVDKRIKSLVIDLIFFVSLIFLADMTAPSFTKSMNKKNQTVCNEQCLDTLVAGVRVLPLSTQAQEKFEDYIYKVDSDPKEQAHFNTNVVSKFILLAFYGFFFVLPQVFLGVSLGKALSKVRIEHAEGGPLSWSQGFTREVLGKFISLLTVVGPLIFIFQKKRRALHDLISNSIVVELSERSRD